MEKLCDLHAHSNYSDGTLTPAGLLQKAEEVGLAAVALTDHNTVAGLPEFLQAGENSPVEAVPGMEFTTEFEGLEIHILGLYLPQNRYPEITQMMQQLLQRKQQQNRALVAALRQEGMDLDYEELLKTTRTGNMNRAHIAMAMVEKGYVATRQEAFKTWLSPERGLYVPPKRLDAVETIGYIKSIGAVAVLAHPFLSVAEQTQLHRLLSGAVDMGLDGMEVLYSEYDAATTRRSWELAEQYGLLPSGGSDYHGGNKPHIRLGTGRGELKIPLSLLEALKKRIGKE